MELHRPSVLGTYSTFPFSLKKENIYACVWIFLTLRLKYSWVVSVCTGRALPQVVLHLETMISY